MLTQADDFKKECDALYGLLKDLPDAAFDQPTQFKGWAINDVLEHLHIWNWAAHESLVNEDSFTAYIAKIMAPDMQSLPLKERERQFFNGEKGQVLLAKWHEFYQKTAAAFRGADPKMRLKWAGPDMSARSSITARLMETWAHGQEIYDSLGVARVDGDHIQNIVILGINTFKWTYATRKEHPPGPIPYVELTAPSGETWAFGDVSDVSFVKGAATDFCQVVTQVRNIADTSLTVAGPVATDWMSKAQCFAGAPEDPPAPGSRFTR